jgi:hypothetical protein
LAFILVSIKYNEDGYFANDFYAKVGGITIQEMNLLELEAIILLNHTLFVGDEFFYRYKMYLNQYIK